MLFARGGCGRSLPIVFLTVISSMLFARGGCGRSAGAGPVERNVPAVGQMQRPPSQQST